jgi:eukaryotic-like serine/threonine-protein kinase
MEKGPRPPDTTPRSPYAQTVAATPVVTPVITQVDAPPGQLPAGEAEAMANPRYVLGDRLGEGGMGDVRSCHDEFVGRDVALKQMRPALASRSDLRARFLREARVQGRMEHPSIVPVYDLDVASGTPFFTMKRVRGATLGDILTRLHAREKEAVESYSRHKLLAAFVGVCLTVDLAHKNGVVHRDLKPDNIMLGSYGELYVLDWGIAKIADDLAHTSREDAEIGALRTRTGAFLGTPGYMAPEQLDEPSGADARADVYALGAILFEIVTLEPLHPIADVAAMALATRMGVEARPSVRRPGCDTTRELDAICKKATALARDDRYASVRELYEAVERFREKDRDLEQRRAQATEHARNAATAARDAESELDPGVPHRILALHEASVALALDPANAGAFEVVKKLLANPPRMPPPEVDRELAAATSSLYRGVTRGGSLLILTWFAYFPFSIVVGVRSVDLYVLVSVLFASAALFGYLGTRKAPSDGRPPLPILLLVAAPLASLATVWSPLVLLPPLAITYAAGMIVAGRSRAWPVKEAVMACAIVVVPVALALAGVVPPFFAFEGGRMLILPVMITLPATLTSVVSTITLVLIVASVFWWSVYLRTALSKSERTLHLYAWHLGQVLTGEPAHERRSPPPRPPVAEVPAEHLITVVDTGAGRIKLDDPINEVDRGSTRYEPVSEVATPGEGRVLVFEDRRIGRRVAMKRVDVRASEVEKGRLHEEADIRARLEHPSIPPIYDAGTDEDGGVFFTMRRPRGVTLADAISLGNHSLYRLVEAFETACRAVEYAHASRVVHQSLGLERVVIGDYGEVYVTGWESARSLVGDADERDLVRADVAALVAILGSLVLAAQEALVRVAPDALFPEGGYVPPELEAICASGGGFSSAGELCSAVVRFLEGEKDVSKRRARAAEHITIAEQAILRTFAVEGGGEEDRAVAMRAVSQALALDPSNPRAASALMRLLTVPPRTLPASAEEEMAVAGRADQQRSSRIACVLYLTWFVYAPFILAEPGASVSLVLAVSVVFAAAAAAFWLAARGPRGSGQERLSTVAFSMLAAAALGTVAGPLVLVPTLVVGNVIGFVLQVGSRRRAMILVLGCLAFAAPVALQALGVIPPSYVAQGEALAIVHHLVPQRPISQVVLTVVQVMVILSACVFFRRFRDARNQAEEKIHVYAWQLRQLVPIEALPPQA